MKKLDLTMLIGFGLIVVGALFMLQTLGIVEGILPILWMLIFAASGAIFLYFYWINRESWWALIPGFTLLGLAGLLVMTEYGPKAVEDLAATLFLGSIGISFFVIYGVNRENWWAIIPGGVLLSVAVMVLLESLVHNGDLVVSIFFLGLASTFAALALLPSPSGRMRWALIPAGILSVMALIFFGIAVEAFQYIWPAGIILVGLYILYRTLFKEKQGGTDLEVQ
jgi:hypothetical protein